MLLVQLISLLKVIFWDLDWYVQGTTPNNAQLKQIALFDPPKFNDPWCNPFPPPRYAILRPRMSSIVSSDLILLLSRALLNRSSLRFRFWFKTSSRRSSSFFFCRARLSRRTRLWSLSAFVASFFRMRPHLRISFLRVDKNSVFGKWGFGFCNWGLTFGWKIAS